MKSMDDDFNTPEALAVIQTLTREINTARDAKKDDGGLGAGCGAALSERCAGAGAGSLRRVVPELQHGEQARGCGGCAAASESRCDWRGQSRAPARQALSDTEIQGLVDARAAARAAKNWAESDRLRGELAAAGVIVEDKPGGKATWRRK